MKNPMIVVLFAMVCAMFILLMSIVGGFDFEEQERQQNEYCEMVSIWKSQSNVNPEFRAGWPDFNGNYDQICK